MGSDRPDQGRHLLAAAVAASVALVVALTLLPAGGGGWAWGAPLAEARWYVSGLDSGATLVQLVGNVVLLVPLAVSAVLRWPLLRRRGVLTVKASAAGTAIELLQWVLPLGRVVSPLDAALDAAGAVAAGLVAAALAGRGRVAALGIVPGRRG
ncbi:VanZ family protein [Geodermatophilus sp. SYSU D00697]